MPFRGSVRSPLPAAVWGAGLAALAAVLCAGCQRPETAASAANGPAGPRPVGIVTPKQGEVARTIAQPGTIEGIEEATLYARASGYLKEVRVDKGDRVSAGQV